MLAIRGNNWQSVKSGDECSRNICHELCSLEQGSYRSFRGNFRNMVSPEPPHSASDALLFRSPSASELWLILPDVQVPQEPRRDVGVHALRLPLP